MSKINAVPETKKHFYMASVILFLTMADGTPGSHQMNVLVICDGPYVNKKSLETIQQSAQAQLFQKSEGATDYKVEDIIYTGLSYLGEMTPSEFHGPSIKE